MNIYTGIGSRKTPADMLKRLAQTAYFLAKRDWILRSGGAIGADQAFEKGCDAAHGKKEIFLPNNNVPGWAYDKVVKYLPRGYNWKSMKPYTKALLARNMQQIFGKDGDVLTSAVICWTPLGRDDGGTGYAIRAAWDYGIPVYNVSNDRPDEDQDRLHCFLQAQDTLFKTLLP